MNLQPQNELCILRRVSAAVLPWNTDAPKHGDSDNTTLENSRLLFDESSMVKYQTHKCCINIEKIAG